MPLTRTACAHCGHWHLYFAGQDPPGCIVCTDVRNALPPDGWEFLPTWKVSARVTNTTSEPMPGVFGVSCDPPFGLGATGWLVTTPAGNLAFEAAPYYHEKALKYLESKGGVDVLSCSHPHGMGALWQLAEHFRSPVVIHKDGVRYTKAFRVTWPADDVHELLPGVTMHHVGGHYEGHSVVHDAARKAIFAGDALKIDFHPDGRPRAISCHKGYHYEIPLSHGEIRHYRDVFAGLPFEHVFTPFEYAAGVTRDHALALFDRLLSGPPTAKPVALDLL